MKQLLLLILITIGPFSHGKVNEKSVTDSLKKAIKASGIKSEALGIYVSIGEKNNTTTVYENNPAKEMIPASLSKIITAGAALSELRPGTRFTTELATAGSVENNVLKGDLYLIGGGDSGFVSESMWNLVNEFYRNQIHIIEGDLVVDDTWFDQIRQDPSREESDVDRAYNSPIGAMSFNWNSVNVFVRPAAKKGQRPQVFVDPQNNYIRVINDARTVEGNKSISIQVKRVTNPDKTFKGNTIRVTGGMPLGADEKVFYRSITEPEIWSGYNLRAFLERRGIEVTGTVRKGTFPQGVKKVLADVESHSVEKMVKDMMKFSNNYVAEMLVKQISATRGTPPGSIPDGMNRVRQFLADNGVAEGITIENPSGLTRKNKFRPKALHDFLISMRGHFDIFAENLSSYPLAGVDGTLEKRMRDTPAEGWVRAKTGLLSGVIGLAGFAGRRDGQTYNFVFLFNGAPGKVWAARDLFDQLAVILASAGSSLADKGGE